jgi:hypothetical protein
MKSGTILLRSLALAAFAVPALPSLIFAGGHQANGTFAGNRVYMTLGPTAARQQGDYIAHDTTAPAGLNTFHRLFIEVPPSLSTMTVQVFDADIHANGGTEGFAQGGMDDDVGGSTTTCDYSLINPGNTTVVTTTVTEGPGASNVNIPRHNAWQTLTSAWTVATPAAGHWEVRVNINGGSDHNGYGVRAFHTTSGTGDTELNVYSEITAAGFKEAIGTQRSRTWTTYPFITSGCNCRYNNFDYDSRGTWSLASRTGDFTANSVSGDISVDDTWDQQSLTGWTSDTQASDYGIWTLTTVLNGSFGSAPGDGPNVINDWFAASTTTGAIANTPTANPPTIAYFRTYLPTDGNAAPIKPYIHQYLTRVTGSGAPTTGVVTRMRA